MKKAAILAAGDSTRMLPLSANMPKHLLPVAGQPLIFHTLKALKKAGIKETLIIYGYRGEALKESIDGQDWGSMKISYVLQSERKGTAHAAGYAKEFAADEDILLMNGDVMSGPGTFQKIIEYHKKGKYGLTIAVYPKEDPSAFGVVSVKNGQAIGLVEKPKPDQEVGNLVNAGVYAVGTDLWTAIEKTELSDRGEYEITDSFRMLIQKGNVGGFIIESWWLDVGKPWDLLEVNKLIMMDIPRKIEGTVEEGAVIKGNTIVAPSALIKSGAYIEGPVYIGENCVIGPNCYIRAYTSLGRKVKIGNAVEIKNCIIMDETNVGHLSYVGDTIIGRKSNFGAGTITANLRHDNKAVQVAVKGERISSGRRKLGAIIADDVKTGIGTSISPGIVIHQGARTGIGVIVDRDIEAHTLVVTDQIKITTKLEQD